MDISELDFTGYSMVERNPAKLSGTPILRGSRMPPKELSKTTWTAILRTKSPIYFNCPTRAFEPWLPKRWRETRACVMNIFFDKTCLLLRAVI